MFNIQQLVNIQQSGVLKVRVGERGSLANPTGLWNPPSGTLSSFTQQSIPRAPKQISLDSLEVNNPSQALNAPPCSPGVLAFPSRLHSASASFLLPNLACRKPCSPSKVSLVTLAAKWAAKAAGRHPPSPVPGAISTSMSAESLLSTGAMAVPTAGVSPRSTVPAFSGSSHTLKWQRQLCRKPRASKAGAERAQGGDAPKAGLRAQPSSCEHPTSACKEQRSPNPAGQACLWPRVLHPSRCRGWGTYILLPRFDSSGLCTISDWRIRGEKAQKLGVAHPQTLACFFS